MRILVVGANGFIAREIITHLALAGHEIVACVHNRLFPNTPHHDIFRVNFIKATTVESWLPHLNNIDAVINCVGVFSTVRAKTIWTIHYEAPKALFTACLQKGIKKVIQISALGIDKVDVPYAKSKLALDEFLLSQPTLSATIIRPGLVYGKGSYGGSSLFRGLAAIPFVIPMPGAGKELQQPVHIDDLAQIVTKALILPGSQILTAVGCEKLSVKNVLLKMRTWLGFSKALPLPIPKMFIALGAKLGNFIPNSPMSETGIKMMTVDNIASNAEEKNLSEAVGFIPRSFTSGLLGMVSSVQDRWHARLYFLRPLLRLSLGLLWVLSGIISLVVSPQLSYDILTAASIPVAYQSSFLMGLSSIDILLGLATFCNYRLLMVGTIQCLVIIGYSLFIAMILPTYLLHPFAPIIKNIPLVVATLIMMALASDQ